MFGDLMGMMGKLKETQQKIEETKSRLDSVIVEENSSNNLIKASMTANRKLKSLDIDESLLNNKEELEDYLIITINNLINKATSVNEAELGAVAKEGMPNIPGMDMFK